MSDGQQAEVRRLFLGACRLERGARTRWLAGACGGDRDLLAEVEALLEADADDGGLFERTSEGAEVLAHALADEDPSLLGNGDPAAGTAPEIPGYRIEGLLGRGGMGMVYEAVHVDSGRRVALKVLHPALASEEFLRRFRREVRVLGQLQHPGIAQILASGTRATSGADRPFFAMELVEGQPIDDYARTHELDTAARLELVARICDAVHYAHEKGVVHRDLKPANILIGGDVPSDSRLGRKNGTALPQPKVLDFGVARATDADLATVTLHTAEGQLVGTVPYMSPEQAAGDPAAIDRRSDVYSIGVIAFELLAGCLPYGVRGKLVHEAVRVIREDEPSSLGVLNSSLRGDVETIVAKALEKDPARRYATAAEMAADIRRHQGHLPIVARPPSTLYQLKKFARRNKTLVGGTVATVLVAVVGAVVAMRFAIEARARADELERESYVSGLAAAATSIEQGDYVAADRYLDGLPTRLRGWEYEHLRARLAPSYADWSVPSPIAAQPVLDRDGRRMYALMADGALGTWDLRDGQLLETRTLDIPGLSARYALPSGAGRRIAMVTKGGEVVVSSLQGRPGVRVAPGTEARRAFVYDWDAPGERLLWGRQDPVELYLWDGTRSRALGSSQVTTHVGDRIAQCSGAIFDPTGDRIAILGYSAGAKDKAVWLLDGASGEVLARQAIDDIGTELAFSPDGERLAVAFGFSDVHVLNGRTLAIEARPQEHRDAVFSLAWNPSGSRLVTSSKDGTVRVRDASLWGRAFVLAAETTLDPSMQHLALEGLGQQRFAVVTVDGSDVLVAGSRIQRLPLEDPSVLREHESYVYNLAFAPDGFLLASSAYREGGVLVWDVNTMDVRWRLPATRGVAERLLAFSEDGRRLVVHDRTTRQWDLTNGEELPVSSHESMRARILATLDRRTPPRLAGPGMAVSPDGARVAWCRQDGTVLVFDASRSLLDWWPTHIGSPNYLDDSLTDWLLELVTEPAVGTLEGHVGAALCVDFSPDGTRIATGGRDGMVRIWDARTFKPLLVLRGHRQYVKDLLFSPDGSLVASASGDKTIRLWDTLPLSERRAKAEPTRRAQDEDR